VKTTRCVDLFGTALISALCLLSAAARADEETKSPERIATVPSGKFYLVRYTEVDQSGSAAGQRMALVAANDPQTRVPLPISEQAKADTEMGLAFISTDEQWIFSDDTLCPGRLYHRKGELECVQEPAECLREAAFRFLAEQEKIDEKLIGPLAFGSIEFVDWSSDSRRLLLALSASIGPAEKGSGGGIFKKGIGWWLCYFNTETGKFELTDRLRTANRDTRKQWDGYSAPSAAGPMTPLSAEPVGHEAPWMPVKRRFETTDKHLNEVYAALLKKLEPAAREQLKKEQREWLIQRDADAAVYANQHWGPFGELALLEGKAIATEARTANLQKQLKP
jgi:Lysozyme inhibitor LprI